MQYKEYLTLATKICTRYNRHKDDDCVSDVFNALVKANTAWDGRGDQHSYVTYMGKLAARRYLFKLKKNKDVRLTGSEFIINKPIRNMLTRELLSTIFDNLNGKEKECVYLKFVDNMSMNDIGTKLGCTKQNVSLIINKAIDKIKTQFGEEYAEYLEMV
jgi:RNA polymerase sigma factor (sigma-70 family)